MSLPSSADGRLHNSARLPLLAHRDPGTRQVRHVVAAPYLDLPKPSFNDVRPLARPTSDTPSIASEVLQRHTCQGSRIETEAPGRHPPTPRRGNHTSALLNLPLAIGGGACGQYKRNCTGNVEYIVLLDSVVSRVRYSQRKVCLRSSRSVSVVPTATVSSSGPAGASPHLERRVVGLIPRLLDQTLEILGRHAGTTTQLPVQEHV